jgi:hypothetical protein
MNKLHLSMSLPWPFDQVTEWCKLDLLPQAMDD